MLIPYQTLLSKYSIKPTGVLHIGANTGQEVDDYYSNGIQRTIWIEANPKLIPELQKNVNRYPNSLIFNVCTTEHDNQEVKFKISNNEGQSSSILDLHTHKIAHPTVHYIDEIILKTKRIDTLFIENNLDIQDYDFVNIDIQGAELLSLKGFGDLLYQVKYLFLEVNDEELYSGCALYPEIVSYLGNFNFEPKEKVMAGNFGWGDAFFINKY